MIGATEPLRVRVPPSLANKIDAEAERRLVSRSAIVRMALLEGLSRLTPVGDPEPPAKQEAIA